MAENQSALDALTQMLQENSSSAPQATPSDTGATNQFPGTSEVPTKEKPKTRGGKKNSSTALLRNAISGKAISKESPIGSLRIAFSEIARVCGYTSPSNDKFDFAKKKDSTTGDVTIFVRNTPPSKADGAIVKYPIAIWNELAKSNPDNMNAGVAANAKPDTLTIIPIKNLISWMQTYSAGYLREDDNLFEPVVRKAGKNVITVNTREDVASSKRSSGTPNEPAIYVDLPTTIRAGRGGKGPVLPKLRIKSNYRTNLLTPHNYIARRRYVTTPVKTAYTKDEIAKNMELYLQRYNERAIKSSNSLQPAAWAHLSSACASFFSTKQDSNGKFTLTGTNYFTDNAGQSAWNVITVDDWFRKDPATGAAIKIPGLEVPLVVHHKPDPEKNATIKKEELQDPAKAPKGAYTLDLDGQHARINRACGGMLTFSHLEKFYAENGSTRGSSGSLSGMNLMGLSEETIASLLHDMASMSSM